MCSGRRHLLAGLQYAQTDCNSTVPTHTEQEIDNYGDNGPVKQVPKKRACRE